MKSFHLLLTAFLLAILPARAGLVAEFLFNGDTQDSSGNANHGTFVGNATPTFTTDRHGNPNGAISFDGIDDYLNIAQNVGLPLTQHTDFTITGWVKGPTNQIDKRIFSEGSTTALQPLYNLGTDLAGTNGKLAIFIRDDGNNILVSHHQPADTLYDDTWHQFTVIDRNGELTIFIDGVLQAGSPTYTRSPLTANTTTLGGILRATPGNFFEGALDDIRFYDTAPAGEILAPGDPIIAIDSFGNSSASPSGGEVTNAIDRNSATKYLNLGGTFSGLIVTPASGASFISHFIITTATNNEPWDPASYELYGTNDAITSTQHSTGTAENWTLIGSGPLALPAARLTPAPTVELPGSNTAYRSYKLLFPQLKYSSGHMHIGEVQFFSNTVRNTNDSGPGSLRQAIIDADPGSTIVFELYLSGQTITLSGTQMLIDKDLTIDASSLPKGITISGNSNGNGVLDGGESRIFETAFGTNVVLRGLSLRDGQAQTSTAGDFVDRFGGAIFSQGSLTLENCLVANCRARLGGAIAASGPLTCIQSTFAENSASDLGGALHLGGTTTITQSTITENSANSAGGGIHRASGSANLIRSIVAGNTAATSANISGGFGDGGNNLTSGDPQLHPLGDYGGRSHCMPPLPASPAVDGGGSTTSPFQWDQRGDSFTRVIDGNLSGTALVDIGAAELQPIMVTTTADAGPGSLRQAVTDAGGNQAIVFHPSLNGGTITLTSGQIFLDGELVIDAISLPNGITISGNSNGNGVLDGGESRIFETAFGSNVVLRGLSLRDGQAQTSTAGDFVDRFGGAIFSQGSLTLENCLVANCRARLGGAIAASGPLTCIQSTFAENSASDLGGALHLGGTTTITQSTITENSAASAGGGIHRATGSANLIRSIVAGNTAATSANISGGFGDGGNNLTSGDPQLHPLGDYGGRSHCMPPRMGSPAIDGGGSTTSPYSGDQRGASFARVLGGNTDDSAVVDIGAVEAQIFWVTTPDDDGPGSLRQAVADASPGGTVFFSPLQNGATITLSTGQILLDKSLTIDASTLDAGITISGNANGNGTLDPGESRIFEVPEGATVLLRGLRLINGQVLMTDSGDSSYGGAIFTSGQLTLEQCLIDNCRAAAGGGIWIDRGTVDMVQSTVSGCSAAVIAGGIFNINGATLNLTQSTLSGNFARDGGGGIYNFGSVNLTQSTLSGNSVTFFGGGIYHSSSGTLNLTQSTLSGNSAHTGGGIHNFGTPNLTRSIIAGNPAGGNVTGSGTLNDDGNSLTSGDPLLAPLGDYGGSTQTMPPLPGSPALNTALGFPGATDQRGLARGEWTWENDFSTPDLGGATAYGSGVINADSFRLTPAAQGQEASLVLPAPGDFTTFAASFDLSYTTGAESGFGGPADGISFSFGPNPSGTANEYGVPGAHRICLPTYSFNGSPTRLVYVDPGGIVLASFDFPRFGDAAIALPITVTLDAAGTLTVTYKGDVAFTVPNIGYTHAPGDTFTFGARTGGDVSEQRVDNIRILTNPPGGAPDIGAVESGNPIANFEVTTIADEDDGIASGGISLRDAIAFVGSGSTITFDDALDGQTITLTSGEFLIDKDLIIDASALANGITISGNNASRVFSVAPGSALTLRDLVVRDGSEPTGVGGGIFNEGRLTLERCVVTENTAQNDGGGIRSTGADSELEIFQSTISNNTVTAAAGGGISIATGQGLIIGSTISGNQHATSNQFAGGGMFLFGASLEVENSTIAGNSSNAGGGIQVWAGSFLSLRNATVSNNSAATGAGIHNQNGFQGSTGPNVIEIENSIVSGNAGPNFSGNAPSDLGGNLLAGAPLLAPLGDYGGPTQTMLPFPDSPAIDAATGSTGATDQRGFSRPVDGDAVAGAIADIGAVEFTPALDLANFSEIAYLGNGNTSGSAPASQFKLIDLDLTLATNSGNLARTDHVFAGWNTASNGSGADYAEGGTYTDNAPLTLHAKWTPVGALAVTTGDLVSTGTFGGPFTPSSKGYTLENTGGIAIDWTAGKTAGWVALSATGGTLAPGASTLVTVSFDVAAESLAPDSYNDTVTFTNTSNGLGDTTRGVSLTVTTIPVNVTLGGLARTYDGSPKPVTVTTNPTPVAYTVTYDGGASAPVGAGSYPVAVTVTEPHHSGTANGTLVIAQAAQTITFAALDPVGDDAAPFALTATASSGLPVSYASSDPDVATISGNTVTVNGLGSTTITASQAGSGNFLPAADVLRTLTVVRADPLAVSGGPYKLLLVQSLALDGSGSQPSNGASITTYEWDLDDDDVFGDATGATPTGIPATDLIALWGMTEGVNTIQLKVTDSEGKSAIVSTTVEILTGLTWDSNAAGAGQTNGGGAWLNANQWWDGSANVSWTPGADAFFGGAATNGGAVTLGSPTSVGAISFDTFTGTYTLGSSGQALTINDGITLGPDANAVTFASPVVLGAAQTWPNNSSDGAIQMLFNSTVDNGGHDLTIGGSAIAPTRTTGNVRIVGVISGDGGLNKTGDGVLWLQATPAYTGPTIISGGILRLQQGLAANLPDANIVLNGGVLEAYWNDTFSRSLGTDVGQFQITGGVSGFSEHGNAGLTVRINNNNNFVPQWGSGFFNPTKLVLQEYTGDNNALVTFENGIDLNGAVRTIVTNKTSNPTSTTHGARLMRALVNNGATPSGLVKEGVGMLRMNAPNTFNGLTSITDGTLALETALALQNSALDTTNSVTGTASSGLRITPTAITLGGLVGAKDLASIFRTDIGGFASLATLTLKPGAGEVRSYSGAIANGAADMALVKSGAGTQVLDGIHTYTGATTINDGTLGLGAGGSIATSASVSIAAGGTLDTSARTSYAIPAGQPLTFGIAAAGAGSSGKITAAELDITDAVVTYDITGTPNDAVYVLATYTNLVGTHFAAAPATPSGYTLEYAHEGNKIALVQTSTPYDAWADGAVFTDDDSGDGVANGMAWLLGAADPATDATGLLPAASQSGGNLVLNFTCLKVAKRGGAVLKVQSSNDLGITDPWTSHEALVPDADATVNGVVFVTSANANPDLINVQATIPGSPGTNLFARLTSTP